MIEGDELTRRVLWSLPTGLYLLGSVGDPLAGPWNLMTINLVTQASTEPRVLAFSVERGSVTEGLLDRSGVASLSLLARQDRAVVRRFVKPATDVEIDVEGGYGEMSGQAVRLTPSGAPVLAEAPAWLDLSVSTVTRWASHVLVQAEVVGASATEEFVAGRASERSFDVLRMEDTRMSYGG
jgi:flavin reductase (DIM6/NTAB) family NADH-FMN oxidoreductase RutF